MNGKDEIVLYQPDNTTQSEVRVEKETVWLTQAQMVMLFGRDKSVISRHIKNIFEERELEAVSVVAKYATTATDGKIYHVDYYNLDVIISIGYRVKSKRGTFFRQWATRTIIIQQFNRSHDRFLFIDNTTYHFGASLKDLGMKWFAFSKMRLTANEILKNKN